MVFINWNELLLKLLFVFSNTSNIFRRRDYVRAREGQIPSIRGLNFFKHFIYFDSEILIILLGSKIGFYSKVLQYHNNNIYETSVHFICLTHFMVNFVMNVL